MKKKDELDSMKWGNHHQRLRANILLTSAWLRYESSSILDEFEINSHQLRVLRMLHSKIRNAHNTDYNNEIKIDKTSENIKAIDSLTKRDLVKKNGSKSLNQLTITDKGLQILKSIDKKTGMLDCNVSSLSLEEVKTLDKLLSKMRMHNNES